jgi:hypothetical protein
LRLTAFANPTQSDLVQPRTLSEMNLLSSGWPFHMPLGEIAIEQNWAAFY